MKKFSIITPCYNAEKYIVDTIESVLNQTAVLSGRAELEYIICDGHSTDGTVRVIEEVVEKRQTATVRIVSEKDSGMYDALTKGLMMATGDICAYINAGDFYHEHAFDVILDVCEAHDVNWLTGMTVICNEKAQVVGATTPCGYRRGLIRAGLYGTILPFIQQESTFWKRELNDNIDFNALSRFRYAGDYFLWFQFARTAQLTLVEAYLGTFRIHVGQLSEDRINYFREMNSFCDKPGKRDKLIAFFDRVMCHMPHKIQKNCHWLPIIKYNNASQSWESVYR